MIIASRSLKLRQGSNDIDVPVQVSAPENNGVDWSCHYTIGWPEGTRTSYAGGLDSIQALHLALQKIGVEIYTSDYHKSGALFLETPGKGYGFPVPFILRDLLIGDDAKFF